MTWLLIASLYVSYTPEITTMRFETEQECIQHGNRLVDNDSRFRYFCTDVIWTSGVPIIDLKVWEPDNIQLSWKDKWHIHKQIKATNAINLITSINKTLSKEPNETHN